MMDQQRDDSQYDAGRSGGLSPESDAGTAPAPAAVPAEAVGAPPQTDGPPVEPVPPGPAPAPGPVTPAPGSPAAPALGAAFPPPVAPGAAPQSAAGAPGQPERRRYGCLIAAVVVGLLAIGVFGIIAAGLHELASLFSTSAPVLSEVADARIREELVAASASGSVKKIAVVDIKGMILADGPFDVASTKTISSHLNTAKKDPNVVALVLDMDTPGGGVTASDEIHRAVQKVRKSGKPVVTCMHSLGASGGYLVAAGTDHIVANRLTLTGSIGVLIGALNYRGLFEKIGLESEVYASGELKDLLHGGRERTEKERELIRDLVQTTFEEFAQIVADGRQRYATAQDVLGAEFADGRVLTGEQAHALGLVDQLGYFENAVAKARELGHAPAAKVVRYRRPLKLTDLFLSVEAPAGLGLKGLLPTEARLVKPGRLYYLLPSVLP